MPTVQLVFIQSVLSAEQGKHSASALATLLVKQKEKEKKMTEERVGLEKANIQAKLDSGSMFERETKLWQGKKDLGKDMRNFDDKLM